MLRRLSKKIRLRLRLGWKDRIKKDVKAMEPNLRWKEVAEGKGKIPKNLFEGLVLKAETHKKTKKLKKKKKKKKKR